MNKLIVATMIIGTISNAHAGFGDFASKMTQNVIGTSASSNVNVTDFLTQASATNLLFQESRAALAATISTSKMSGEIQAKLKALKSTTNLQEKEAILASLEKPTDEVMAASKKDEAETIETIKNLSAEKKKYLLAAAQNFGIATLMAKDLAGGASQISTAIISNPQSLTSSGFTVGGAKNLVGDVTGIAKNSSMALVEVPQLFKKAGVEFTPPTSSKSKPQDIEL
ncbi:hypothetical protein [Acinetobacter sp. ANC 4805]|jgi:hypothetical protein|uniref:hypothetical protein n=1 Tax=Acinetobacter sp. ANC 4805 TaxID=2923425 RepID=UPI001F4B2762|nr:hypothetical protein [Acinetobacter sp. ANC 4805]MCH7310456.1 hypothetical protein [Acinetobacter sp. ANC 4805]